MQTRSLQGELVSEPSTATQIPLEEVFRQTHKMGVLGQMAGGLAHDFNNMLQSAVSALDTMQVRIDQGRSGELACLLKIAFTSLNRASILANRILAISRPPVPNWKLVDLNSVIESMGTLLRCALGDQIEFELVLAQDLSPIICDPHGLENAVLNLVVNARDAMLHGGRLVIETCNSDLGTERIGRAQGRYVSICVSDTGIGMAPDVVERAFDPFYTKKTTGRGTGLGLTMTKEFVEQFRGCVDIESAVDHGTAIRLHFPCSRGHDEGKEIGHHFAGGADPRPYCAK